MYLSKINLIHIENNETENKSKNNELINPIVKINLWLHSPEGELIEDTLYWDLAWQYNRPEEFAENYCNDLKLGKSHAKQLTFSIRKQIFDHLKQISVNKKYNLLNKVGVPIK